MLTGRLPEAARTDQRAMVACVRAALRALPRGDDGGMGGLGGLSGGVGDSVVLEGPGVPAAAAMEVLGALFSGRQVCVGRGGGCGAVAMGAGPAEESSCHMHAHPAPACTRSRMFWVLGY